jgi:hypothetical protein
MINDHNRLASGGQGIATLFVRRPVLAIVLNLLVVLAGVAAFTGIEVRELPNVDRPVITIRTDYDDATPETVDKEITAIVEGAVARTPGVVSISSQSSAGESRITVEFSEKTDLDVAASDLRDAIGNLRSLPEDADAPTIVKADADLTRSCVSRRPRRACRSRPDEARQRPRRRSPAAVEGVADVQRRRPRSLVQIMIDLNALAARHLTVADVNQALTSVPPIARRQASTPTAPARARRCAPGPPARSAPSDQCLDAERRRRRCSARPTDHLAQDQQRDRARSRHHQAGVGQHDRHFRRRRRRHCQRLASTASSVSPPTTPSSSAKRFTR